MKRDTMTCSLCMGESSRSSEMSCVEIALEAIQTHFKALESKQQEHIHEIQTLRSSNQELQQRIDWFEKENKTRLNNVLNLGNREIPVHNCSLSEEDGDSICLKLNTALSTSRQTLDSSTIESTSPEAPEEIRSTQDDERRSRGNRFNKYYTPAQKDEPLKEFNLNKPTTNVFNVVDQNTNKKMLLLSLNKHANSKLKQTRLSYNCRSSEKTLMRKKPEQNISPVKGLNPSRPRKAISLKPTKTALSWILNSCNKSPDKDAIIGLTKQTDEKDDSVMVVSPQSPELVVLDETGSSTWLDTTASLPYPAQLKTPTKEHSNQRTLKSEQVSMCANKKQAQYESEEEESEEFMVRPILIKNEPITPKKRTIKEIFNVDCQECEKFLRYMGQHMTNSELEKHIQQCSLHKKPEEGLSLTPPGFWNPHMVSFIDGDPRKEVLVERNVKTLTRRAYQQI